MLAVIDYKMANMMQPVLAGPVQSATSFVTLLCPQLLPRNEWLPLSGANDTIREILYLGISLLILIDANLRPKSSCMKPTDIAEVANTGLS